MELLLIDDSEKKHYVYIKDFNKLMFSFSGRKTKKNIFVCTVFNAFILRLTYKSIFKIVQLSIESKQ